ncbi:hypothetical protein AAHC03_025740 [Spirometra sp. Aus1]
MRVGVSLHRPGFYQTDEDSLVRGELCLLPPKAVVIEIRQLLLVFCAADLGWHETAFCPVCQTVVRVFFTRCCLQRRVEVPQFADIAADAAAVRIQVVVEEIL